MNKIMPIIVPIIASMGLICSLYVWHLNDQNKLRLEASIKLSRLINDHDSNLKTNVDSLRNEIKYLQFEKESYTQYLELMSNWFILFETILFGIFFLVGYGIFETKINDYLKQNEAAQAHINHRYVLHESEFKSLKIENYKDAIQLYDVVSFLNISNGDFGFYIEEMILGIEKAHKVYELEPTDPNLLRISSLYSQIWTNLNKYYEINTINQIHESNILAEFQRKLSKLSNIEEHGIKHLGNECVKRLSGIIIKNNQWNITGIKPKDSDDQV